MRLLLLLLLIPSFAFAQNRALRMTATVETAFGAVAGSYVEKLSREYFREIDVVNTTDCDVQVRLDDISGTPDSVIPAGTNETINFGRNAGFVNTSVSLQRMSGESCSSGSVYLKGIH